MKKNYSIFIDIVLIILKCSLTLMKVLIRLYYCYDYFYYHHFDCYFYLYDLLMIDRKAMVVTVLLNHSMSQIYYLAIDLLTLSSYIYIICILRSSTPYTCYTVCSYN